ncbi:MAG: DUF885 domain-containing protein [Xanthomonadaceae bacterium]|nr:DUF885 domain-containing protein [Xanthomonadaceae bacterium]
MKAPFSVFALTLLLSPPTFAQSDPVTAPLSARTPEWVVKSNQYSRILLDAQASSRPEQMPFFGPSEHHLYVTDLKTGHPQRYRAALDQARNELNGKLDTEQDPNVRHDLQILLHAANAEIQESEIEEKRLLPWVDVPKLVFEGISNILSDETPAGNHDIALVRLQNYTGLLPGTQPITRLARDRYEEKRSDPGLLPPTHIQVANALASTDLHVDGIRSLFKKYRIADSDEALYAIGMQLHGYATWARQNVLPTARTNSQIPTDLYAQALHERGIDIDPRELIRRAAVEFVGTQTAMQQLAPLIGQAQGVEVSDYREVIRMQNQNPGLGNAASPPAATDIARSTTRAIAEADAFITGGRTADSALADSFRQDVADTESFNLPESMAEYQAMSERGVSLARSMFAFNTVNTDGWSLYAESEMLPYKPLDEQMTALQFRLLHAARAMLDPMLNMGHITREQAADILREDVQLPESLVKQELDRYQRLPGQAPSYLYGYHQLQSLRVETELTLGDRFDRKAFNDFLRERGLLLPDQLAEAVRTTFVPSQRGRPSNHPKSVMLVD